MKNPIYNNTSGLNIYFHCVRYFWYYGYSWLSQRIWLVVVLERQGGDNTNYNTTQ